MWLSDYEQTLFYVKAGAGAQLFILVFIADYCMRLQM